MDKTEHLVDLLRKTDREPVEIQLARSLARYEEQRQQGEIDRNWWLITMRQELTRKRSTKPEGR